MIERRVERLEERVGRIEDILKRLEPVIIEIATAGAKRSDLDGMKGTLDSVNVRLGVVEGRTLGIEAVLRQVPNVWQIVTLLVGVSSAIIAAVRYMKP